MLFSITVVFEIESIWLSVDPLPEVRRGEEMFFSTSTAANQGLLFGITVFE